MHSFHPSRGRILFEVLCVLGLSASLVGAWLQTQATALLGAAGFAALYGLSHLFDMRRPKSAETAEPQRIDFEPEAADIVVPMAAARERPAVELVADELPTVEFAAEEAGAAEPAAARSGAGRRTSGSRKGGGRRGKSTKAAKAVDPAPVEEADVPWPVASEETAPIELDIPLEEEFSFPPDDEASHPHIAPLFEPEPFARMPRRAFGRRGRI